MRVYASKSRSIFSMTTEEYNKEFPALSPAHAEYLLWMQRRRREIESTPSEVESIAWQVRDAMLDKDPRDCAKKWMGLASTVGELSASLFRVQMEQHVEGAAPAESFRVRHEDVPASVSVDEVHRNRSKISAAMDAPADCKEGSDEWEMFRALKVAWHAATNTLAIMELDCAAIPSKFMQCPSQLSRVHSLIMNKITRHRMVCIFTHDGCEKWLVETTKAHWSSAVDYCGCSFCVNFVDIPGSLLDGLKRSPPANSGASATAAGATAAAAAGASAAGAARVPLPSSPAAKIPTLRERLEMQQERRRNPVERIFALQYAANKHNAVIGTISGRRYCLTRDQRENFGSLLEMLEFFDEREADMQAFAGIDGSKKRTVLCMMDAEEMMESFVRCTMRTAAGIAHDEGFDVLAHVGMMGMELLNCVLYYTNLYGGAFHDYYRQIALQQSGAVEDAAAAAGVRWESEAAGAKRKRQQERDSERQRARDRREAVDPLFLAKRATNYRLSIANPTNGSLDHVAGLFNCWSGINFKGSDIEDLKNVVQNDKVQGLRGMSVRATASAAKDVLNLLVAKGKGGALTAPMSARIYLNVGGGAAGAAAASGGGAGAGATAGAAGDFSLAAPAASAAAAIRSNSASARANFRAASAAAAASVASRTPSATARAAAGAAASAALIAPLMLLSDAASLLAPIPSPPAAAAAAAPAAAPAMPPPAPVAPLPASRTRSAPAVAVKKEAAGDE